MQGLFSQSQRSSSSTEPFQGSNHSHMKAINSGSSYPSGCCKLCRDSLAASNLRQAICPAAIIILASSLSPPSCARTFFPSSMAAGHNPRIAISSILARLLAIRTIASSSPIERIWKRIRASRSFLAAASSIRSNIQLPPPLIIAPSLLSSGLRSNFRLRKILNLATDRIHVIRKIAWPTAIKIQVTNKRFFSSKPLDSNHSINGIKSPNSL